MSIFSGGVVIVLKKDLIPKSPEILGLKTA